MTGGAMFNFEQLEFRGRNDDGTQVTATWKALANVNWTQTVDQNFRVRFVGQEIGGAAGSSDMQLQYERNGVGGFANVNTTTPVKAVTSPNVTDGTATTNLIGGTGTFIAGTISTDGLAASVSFGASNHTEWEFVLQLDSVQLANNDTIVLRGAYSGDTTPTLTNSPTITVTGVPFTAAASLDAIADIASAGQVQGPAGPTRRPTLVMAPPIRL